MTTLPLLLLELATRLQDSDGVLPVDVQTRALAEAARDIGRYRPRVLVADVVGNGTAVYALPAGWVAEVSSLLAIEYPVGDEPPTYLPQTDWVLYRPNSTTQQLRLLFDTPSAAQSLRLTFTAPHVLGQTPATTSLSQDDEAPAVNKAAAICCLWLATYYAQQGQASLSADVTSHESKSRRYSDLARQYEELYGHALGIGGGNGTGHVAGASSVVDWWGQTPRARTALTHRRGY